MSADEMKLIKQLLEAGVHFGHQTNRWNPKMKKFIFGEKSGIYIIDLEKTAELLKKAQEFLRDVARAGSYILFVGTKKQAQSVVKEQAEKSGMFYVNQRWLGGTLTNFLTIRKSILKLDKLEQARTDGTYEAIAKKEKSKREKDIAKLLKNLAGIRKMDRRPGALFVIDSKKEEIAVKEAKKLSIPIVALIDTNSNPDLIDYIIPGNDDALKSVKLITTLVTESIADGREQFLLGSQSAKADESVKEKLPKGNEPKPKERVETLAGGDLKLREASKAKIKEKVQKKKESLKKKKTN